MTNQISNKNDIVTKSDSSEMLIKRQAAAVEALSIVLKVCEAEDIQFFLLAGSCLGAVRNKGMIPWDDDIDIGLKLDEYDRLRKILPDALNGTEFEFYDSHIAPDFPRMYGKILKDGYTVIDIFKLVPVSNSTLSQIMHWYQKRFWAGMRSHALWRPSQFMSRKQKLNYSIKQIIFFPLMKIFSLEQMTKKLEQIENKYCNITPKYYSTLYGAYSRKKEMFRAEWIKEPIWINFENMSCPTVSDIDPYLKKLYGDYMTPPSEKKRIAKHVFNRFN